ncbi:MAG: rod shape-determining protein MreC [Chloroflexi bacterium]|nr:rod shape-determining protein MreC [Chloroflexota bacterium]
MAGEARRIKGSHSWAVAVILLLLFILSWLILEETGEVNPVRDAFSRVLAPIQFALSRVSRPGLRALDRLGRLAAIEAENEALRRENAELRAEVIALREARIENENYRRQLNFKSAVPNFQLLSAEVIGRDPTNLLQYVIIDRGSADGIKTGMPVLAAEGLVGRIQQVSAASSKIVLITDPSSSVSAMIQRSRATGVVQGYSSRELIMRYIPPGGDAVMPGDIVLTSGLGGNFPRRLPIGQVTEVSHEDVQMFQEAKLIPAADLYDLEMVMVLLNFGPVDLDLQENAGALANGGE